MHAATSESLRSNSRPTLPLLESLSQTLPGKILVAIGATALIAAGAHISLRLPFTPVPLTMSDFTVLLVGMALGPTAAFSVLILYLLEGASGLPVFNPGGLGGVAQLFGPTGGYLVAYPFAAVIAGAASRLSRSGMSSFTAAVIADTGATAIILTFGATWLAHSHYLSASSAWNVAVAPFLFGAAAKVVGAAMIFGSTRRWLRS
jgi:biotin transport system substrate-specific component